MASDKGWIGIGGLRRHDLGGQAPEQLDELLAARELVEQLHDLHDHIIERLFAAGLNLQGTIARCGSPDVNVRLTSTVDDLQSTIEEIRTTVLESRFPGRVGSDLRRRIQNAVDISTQDRDIATTWRFHGPMSVVGIDLADDVEAVVTEAVSNSAQSGASRLMIAVDIADELTVAITDNGYGTLGDNQRLANAMRRRAEHIGGSCRIAAPPAGGTHMRWTAPLIDP